MRIAIFHDYLRSIGGGENSMIFFARALGADVITTDFDPTVLEIANARDVNVTSLGQLTRSQPTRQVQACLRFAGARFESYDFYIFSGNWSRYAGGFHKPNLFYCHTPVRVFYDLKQRFLDGLPPWKRVPARAWVGIHSGLDKLTLRNMNLIVANSENVRRRIAKYYGRDSVVVHPPVATSDFRFDCVGDYWLAVNRFYPEKRVDMQVEIFRRLPDEKLIVVGDTEREDAARKVAAALKLPPNVELAGAVDRRKLIDLYARCKGLITTAVDEDFGMTPVEAMASGKVVLATDEGGYRETVLHNETGWLLPVDVNAFVERIKSLSVENLNAMKDVCIARASGFDEKRSLEKLRTLISAILEGRNPPQSAE